MSYIASGWTVSKNKFRFFRTQIIKPSNALINKPSISHQSQSCDLGKSNFLQNNTHEQQSVQGGNLLADKICGCQSAFLIQFRGVDNLRQLLLLIYRLRFQFLIILKCSALQQNKQIITNITNKTIINNNKQNKNGK